MWKEVEMKAAGIIILILLGIGLMSAVVAIFIKDPDKEVSNEE